MKGKRRFYAEDVAWMFVMNANGYTRRQIGNRFFITEKHVNLILTRAREHGFNKYPKKERK